MSWQQYIECLKQPVNGVCHVKDAAIWGILPNPPSDPPPPTPPIIQMYATDDALKDITVEEVKILSGNSSGFHQNSPKIMGQKFMLLQDKRDDDAALCMVLKKRGVGSMCIGQSRTVLVICFCVEGSNEGSASLNVHKVVKYLKEAQM